MNIKHYILSVFALASIMPATAQTQVIAHRGYWRADGSAQNSITALQRANDIKAYGSEFDVQLTADNVVVVNHDDNIQGHVIAKSKYKDLKNLKLSNGEKLPTLKQYLKAGKKCPALKMILEIKPHKTAAEENAITKLCVGMVKDMGMENQVEYISFSMNVCEQLARLTPGSAISYLRGDLAPGKLKPKGITGIDYHFKVIRQNPQWVEEAHGLGMTVNVWTVNDMDVAKRMKDLKVDYITTDIPEKLK